MFIFGLKHKIYEVYVDSEIYFYIISYLYHSRDDGLTHPR